MVRDLDRQNHHIFVSVEVKGEAGRLVLEAEHHHQRNLQEPLDNALEVHLPVVVTDLVKSRTRVTHEISGGHHPALICILGFCKRHVVHRYASELTWLGVDPAEEQVLVKHEDLFWIQSAAGAETLEALLDSARNLLVMFLSPTTSEW